MAAIDLATHEGFSQSGGLESSDHEKNSKGLSQGMVGVQGSDGSSNNIEFNAF